MLHVCMLWSIRYTHTHTHTHRVAKLNEGTSCIEREGPEAGPSTTDSDGREIPEARAYNLRRGTRLLNSFLKSFMMKGPACQ